MLIFRVMKKTIIAIVIMMINLKHHKRARIMGGLSVIDLISEKVPRIKNKKISYKTITNSHSDSNQSIQNIFINKNIIINKNTINK